MILIYDDAGVSAQSVAALMHYAKKWGEVKTVTGDELQSSAWVDQARLLIMPGGRSLPFYEKLGELGNANIRQFVKQGGAYLGLCAGAYYACCQTIFAKDLPLELILPGALAFFAGNAVGPVFADTDFTYASEKGARVVDIDWDGERYPVYFNGGCAFDEPAGDVVVLARYVDNEKPAIISCSVERGRVVLSGVHPELSYDTIPDDHDPNHQRLRIKLFENEAARVKLLDKLFKAVR